MAQWSAGNGDVDLLACLCVYLAACNVGDEGGFAPNIQNNEEGLSLTDAVPD